VGNGNRPTPEFRREAVRLALTSGRTRREIAEDLGIGLSTLSRWLSQARDASAPSETPVDLHAELMRLWREKAVLTQERDILKEASVGSIGQGNTFAQGISRGPVAKGFSGTCVQA
jgi:transposase